MANAGPDELATFNSLVEFNGSASSDSDGTIVSYIWSENETELSTQVNFSKDDFSVGIHTITLTITDDDGAEATDSLLTVVNLTAVPGQLNDTGITFGGSFPSGNNACVGEAISQQDCAHGRDSTHKYYGDGDAGFSFIKLDANGFDLPASALSWDCVKDNITGLIWEVKTIDGGLRDTIWRYMNTTNLNGYNPTASNDKGSCLVSSVDTDGIYCDTEGYKDAVNTQTLCGANDWRLPTSNELIGLVNYGRYKPSIDSRYFLMVSKSFVWSGAPSANNSDSAWVVSFELGNTFNSVRSLPLSVWLVRSGE